MNSQKISLILLLSFILTTNIKAQTDATENLKKHIYYLADDKLEGRSTGSVGEKIAARYIAAKFMDIGLQARGEGEKNYLESFTVNNGKTAGENNYITLISTAGEKKISCFSSPIVEIFPLNFSASAVIKSKLVDCGYGIIAPELNYDDYSEKNVKDNIAIIRVSTPEGGNPHSAYFKYIDERDKVITAEKKGAIGVIFIHTDENYPQLETGYNYNTSSENIPVMYCKPELTEPILKSTIAEISVELIQNKLTGNNIIGFIDNKAENTIVIGAHYDHLGHGEIQGSLYRGEQQIHNGADDNASGVSLIIELARKLKSSQLHNNNYLIIAFSGEEMGLLGSNAFVNSDLIKTYNINYMLNFDMVGRLDSSVNTVLVNGTGTSPAWHEIDSNKTFGFNIKKSASGIGPSDQTSFYLKDIPVLFFFTGPHEDYHKPSDDADKINYAGMNAILNYSYDIISKLNDNGKIPFNKTVDEKQEDVPNFKVTLGIIPDYAFSGKGLRIDGVTDGKTASKAGLLTGDVIIKLGDFVISDMTSYMKALSKFNKGDKTTVIILRNNSEQSYPVEF